MKRFFARYMKFNYCDSFVLKSTLIYMYRLQWVWVQPWHQTHNIRNMLDSYVYSLRFIDLDLEKYLRSRKVLINDSSDSNHSSIFTVVAVAAFIKKEKTKGSIHTKPYTEYCSVRIRIILILCFVYVSIHEESKSTTSCVLLNMSRNEYK